MTIRKKADIILAILFLLLGGASLWLTHQLAAPGARVVIMVDGKEYGTYSLQENRAIEVIQPGEMRNVIRIENGSAFMDESTCKNQVCVHQGAISLSHQSIVCLPNKVLLEVIVKGGSDRSPDSVTY